MTDATYDICDSYMDETIDMFINLQVWNLKKATHDTCDIWHNETLPEKHVFQKYDFLFVWNENLNLKKKIFLVNFTTS